MYLTSIMEETATSVGGEPAHLILPEKELDSIAPILETTFKIKNDEITLTIICVISLISVLNNDVFSNGFRSNR